MATHQLAETPFDADGEDRSAYDAVLRFDHRGQARGVARSRDLPERCDLSIPETGGRRRLRPPPPTSAGPGPERRAPRPIRSLRQILAAQLSLIAPDPEAKLYYTTLVQDEARDTEAWLSSSTGGRHGRRDPYLDDLAHMTLEADTL